MRERRIEREARVYEIPVGEKETLELEKAVCSHGLFMMSPNYWYSPTKTLFRPLRLLDDTCIVSISQPSSNHLRLLVYGTRSLSPQQHLSLLTQVRRMLRLSEVEDMNVKEFQKMHKRAKERGFGRMFRSPTLFEDMVKCMLLCNCQWPRTLSMARALCELQWELKYPPLHQTFMKVLDGTSSINGTIEDKRFSPNTPEGKDSKRKLVHRSTIGDDSNDICNSSHTSTIVREVDSSVGLEYFFHNKIGNFPSPREIANLDEDFLAKRCGLGYRASRVLNLARIIVEGNIQLTKLEEVCREPNLLNYSQLAEQLKEINGFGPYTCSNVLMCMGFYHVVPSDSETVRHLNQVHKTGSTIKSVQRDVEMIYGNYAPFQFLAYWWEVWEFYSERFGKLSEMPPADYKLITASKMRSTKRVTGKRTKSGDEIKPQ